MSQSNDCPECGKALSARSRRCSCGWFQAASRTKEIVDHRCQYVIAQRRCPLPGTMCQSPNASNQWYCCGHIRSLSDSKLSEEILRDAEQNFHQIMEARHDWRTR